MTDRDAELDALLDMLEGAGLIEQYTDDDGRPAMRLTERGTQLGRAMAMAGGDADAELVLEALLDASRGGTTTLG